MKIVDNRYIIVSLIVIIFGMARVSARTPRSEIELGGAPEYVMYTGIYDFIEELAEKHIIEVNSVTRPYDRRQIASWLTHAAKCDSLLTTRQRRELKFFINDYALELDTIPTAIVQWTNKRSFNLGLLQPAFHYRDKKFKAKINPIIGMDLSVNSHGMLTHRWWGVEIRTDILNHIAIWGSIRDHSYSSEYLKDEFVESLKIYRPNAAFVANPTYLTNERGGCWHRSSYGGDYAEIRAGIKAYAPWGSIGIVKDNISWGDSYHGSNIISDRVPSFPMIELKIQPCKWFKLDYINAFLASGVADSSRYYDAYNQDSLLFRSYKNHPKYMAANMLTFTPVRGLDLSVGSSVVYANPSLFAAFSIPISLFNSVDYQMSDAKGENENSQLFFNISTRNLKYTHFYASVFIDEIKFSRFKKSNQEHNFIGWKVGGRVSNFPVDALSLVFEFTRTNIANYQHPYRELAYTTNGYVIGHYLGDNAQSIYVALGYKPVRGLSLQLSYAQDTKYNEYKYTRIRDAKYIVMKPFDEKVWRNDEVKFHAVYEVVNNAYATVDVLWNNARGYTLTGDSKAPEEEIRLDAVGYLKRYTPPFYYGKNFTVKVGFSFYF